MTEKDLIIPSKIIYSLRRSISLIINNDGEFIVRAPKNCSRLKIDNFIAEKKDWLIKKRREIYMNKPPEIDFNGGEIAVLGKELTLSTANIKRVKSESNILYLPNIQSKQYLVNYLKKELKKYLTIRVKEIAVGHGFNYQSISISSAKTNWGSCSGNNKLHFTYKLALCPLSVIDYLIVHELTHTVIKNHSVKFWKRIEKLMPNYKVYEKWLKQNRAIISLI